MQDGFTKYTPSSGIPELRQAAADKFKRDNGLTYKPSQIIISCGGKHSCCNVIMATCNPGDEVIIPAPYWLSYPEMVRLAEATPVILQTSDKTEFKITPEQLRDAITPRTRLFILNSPSNPTGSLYTPEEIKALGDVCVEKGVLIMSDEIYEKLVYDGAEHASVAGFSPAALRAHHHCSRVGQGLFDDRLAHRYDRGAGTDCQSHRRHPKPQHEQPDFLRAKGRGGGLERPAGSSAGVAGGIRAPPRLCLEEAQQHSRAFPASTPKAPFISSLTFPRLGLSPMDFCAQLLEQEKVAAVPGIAFGADDYIRISYATSMENLEKGLDRIEKFARSLKG